MGRECTGSGKRAVALDVSVEANLRSNVANNAMGPTMDASLALEKKDAIVKQKPIEAVENNPIQTNKYITDENLSTFADKVYVTNTPITKKTIIEVISQDHQLAHGFTPRI
jgi:hypothetical protein